MLWQLASMPELPEVEITRRNLLRWFDQRRVIRAEAEKTRIFRGAERARFEAIAGRLEDVRRRGKYLLLRFERDQGLLAHLGMTGKFVRRPAGVPEPYSRARFVLEGGEVIHFRDPRMFGRLEPVPASRLFELAPIAELGRDPLEDGLTAQQLAQAVGDSKQDIKVALMDQRRIAGLGNIHAAEALFRARVHPARKAVTLRPEEWKRLAAGIHQTLRYAIERESSEEIEYVEEPGAPNPFLVYGRAGEPCPRCKTTLRSFKQGGRTTHYCPSCQKKGAVR